MNKNFLIINTLCVLFFCCNALALADEQLKQIENLIKEHGKYQIADFIRHRSTNHEITVQVDNKFYLKFGMQSLEYITTHSINTDLKRLKLTVQQADVLISEFRIKKEKIAQHKEKKSKEDRKRDERPIGTVVLDNERQDAKYARVWQIVTTNNIVDGYSGFMELDSGKIRGNDEIDRGVYNQLDGFMTLEHHWYKYENIRAGLTISKDIFKIIGNSIYDKQGKNIGTFYPNQFLLKNNVKIPNGQGCSSIWGDSSKKVYFTKQSRFFNEYVYPYNVRFFCSEQDAVNSGYKKSLK